MLALSLLALLVFSPRLGWGIPHATASDRVLPWSTDDILPLGALAEMHNTFVSSKPTRNYAYPWCHYAVVAAVQAPYLAGLGMLGDLESPSQDYPFGLKDPVAALRVLTLIGRLLTLAMAIGVVLAARAFVSTLFGDRAGWIAGVLTLTSPLLVYYSGTGNLEVPALFWSSWGLVVFARIMTLGLTARRAMALGVLCGLGIATKDQVVVIFLPLGIALLFPRFRGANPGHALQKGLAASLVAYALGTGLWVDPARHVTHVRRLLGAPDTLSAGNFYFPPRAFDAEGISEMLVEGSQRFAEVMTPPALLCALMGLFLVGRRSPRLIILVLPLALHLLLLVLPLGHVIVRYFLPYVWILDAFAAAAIVGWASSGRVLFFVLLPIVGWRGLQCADLTHAQLFDTRHDAARWLSEHAHDGDVIEFFGHENKLPRLRGTVKTRRAGRRDRWEGDLDHGARVLELWKSEGPEYVLVIPDWTSGATLERSRDCPAEVFAALGDGSAGYVLAANFSRVAWLPKPLARPRLDYPTVAPPVHIFVRRDVAERPRPR